MELLPWPLFTEAEAEAFFLAPPVERLRTLVAARSRQKKRLDAASQEIPTVVIQRSADVLGLRTMERKAIQGRRLVYDVDDAIWHEHLVDGASRLNVLKLIASKSRWLASRAHVVIAGNEILAEYLSRYTSRVEIVPSLVGTESIDPRQHTQQSSIVLGWIGSPSTMRHLTELLPTIDRFATELPDTRVILLVVGSKLSGRPRIEVREQAWSPESERAALRQIDIGLMPLRDEPWARGKCAYKALLYMAAGIPAVVADVGVSGRVVDGAGIAVNTSAEWVEALLSLSRDPELRTTLGRRGRARVESDYSIRAWAPRLARLIGAP